MGRFEDVQDLEKAFDFEPKSGRITKCRLPKDTSGELSIPERISGAFVKVIEKDVFAGYKQMTKLSIPSCVEEIKERAFENCSELVSLELSSRTNVAETAFHGCFKLPSDNFGDYLYD